MIKLCLVPQWPKSDHIKHLSRKHLKRNHTNCTVCWSYLTIHPHISDKESVPKDNEIFSASIMYLTDSLLSANHRILCIIDASRTHIKMLFHSIVRPFEILKAFVQNKSYFRPCSTFHKQHIRNVYLTRYFRQVSGLITNWRALQRIQRMKDHRAGPPHT